MRINELVMVFLFLMVIFGIRHFDRCAPINRATKVCLVTGASSGLGQHIAIEMVKRGWRVIGVARRAELLDQLSQSLNSAMFIPFICDVSDPRQIHTVSEAIKSLELQPTLFFLNAGMGELSEKWRVSTEVHQKTFATNYFGAITWIEEWLLPVKQLGGGTFVAISSAFAFMAAPGSDAYAASKIALAHSFDAFRRQYYYDNIGFTVVFPGPIDTAMLKGDGVEDLPFRHQPDEEARYIIDQVFAGKKFIEPSWFYSIAFRLLNLLPDALVLKICSR